MNEGLGELRCRRHFLVTVTCARSVQVIVTVFTCSFWERLTV